MPPFKDKNDIYSTHGEVYLSASDLRRLDGDRATREAQLRHIATRIQSKEIPFPLKKHFMTPEDVVTWFQELRVFKPGLDRTSYVLHGYESLDAPTFVGLGGSKQTIVPFNGTHLSVRFDAKIHAKVASLTDFFTEYARMQSARKDENGCPAELWLRPDLTKRIVDKAAHKYGEISQFSLRMGMYGIINGCNVFKPEATKALFDMFGAERVLDMSAGWGDRLLGAMASTGVKRYLAFDPNKLLEEGHSRMMHKLHLLARTESGGEGKYEVRYEPFETAVIEEKFQLCFTSPPFFDLELYTSGPASSDSSQSTTRHPTFERWMTGFLYPAMRNAWNALEQGGHLVIYINDIPGNAICKPMLEWGVDNLEDCVYVGVVGLQSEGRSGKVRPCWVWRKGDVPIDKNQRPPIYNLTTADPNKSTWRRQPSSAVPGVAGGGPAPAAEASRKRKVPEQTGPGASSFSIPRRSAIPRRAADPAGSSSTAVGSWQAGGCSVFKQSPAWTLYQGDVKGWLEAQPDHSLPSVFLSIPDISEMRHLKAKSFRMYDVDKYAPWMNEVAGLVMRKVRRDCYCVFYQTDRNLKTTTPPCRLSKFLVIAQAAQNAKIPMLWHKVATLGVNVPHPQSRPTFSHLFAFSYDQPAGPATPDVIPIGTKLWDNGSSVEAVQVFLDMLKGCPAAARHGAMDLFAGEGTVGAMALEAGIRPVVAVELEDLRCANTAERYTASETGRGNGCTLQRGGPGAAAADSKEDSASGGGSGGWSMA